MLIAPSRMSHYHVLHKANEKAAEVVGVSVEIIEIWHKKMLDMFNTLPYSSYACGNSFPGFTTSKRFISLSAGHPVPVSSVLGSVSGYMSFISIKKLHDSLVLMKILCIPTQN